tara:strand:- start:412 stop:786 length:375 start_codon:yes stop_codon:yes gene_type:complete
LGEIKTGSLVKLHRRRKQGIGLVVKQIDDVAGMLLIEDGRELTATCRDLLWHERSTFIDQIAAKSGESELCYKFFYFNAKWCKKYKNSFSLVRWFKTPSLFTMIERETVSWYPTDWLKTVKKDH